MTDSKLLDIVEDIKNLSTSGNKIQVEEYKNGKKVEPYKKLSPNTWITKKEKKKSWITKKEKKKDWITKKKDWITKKDYPKIGKDY